MSFDNKTLKKAVWKVCKKCKEIISIRELEENLNVCPKCNHHNRLSADERLEQVLDKDTFKELFTEITTKNVLNFEGYEEKIEEAKKKSSMDEAVKVGAGSIEGNSVAIGVMDSNFMMGSMGVCVGEKISLLVEYADKERIPLILFTASGGARMQEGILSLMQMAKTSMVISRFKENGGLYIVVITDPTTGGVTASFAMEGDIVISEPKALIGFAGKKVIKNTIKENIFDDVQSAEMNFRKGFIDDIVSRKDIRCYLSNILEINKGIRYERK